MLKNTSDKQNGTTGKRRTSRQYSDVQHLFERLHGPVENLRYSDRDSLRDHLVLLHAPLVEHCARNFLAAGEPLEDLVQEGYVGLIKAVDRFDPEKGVRFSTYACHLISGEIRHYLRDLGRLIHEPGWHFELRQRISRTADQLAQNLARPAESEEIALALNIEVQTVRDVLRNQQTLVVEYLDAEPDRESDDNNSLAGAEHRLNSAATTPGAEETQVEDQMMLGLALPQLRELEKRAVMLFFFDDLSKTEIARRLDISINHAAYLIKRGVDGLRQIIDASEGGLMTDDIYPAQLMQGRARAAYLLELAKNEANKDLKPANGNSGAPTESTPAPRRATPNRRSMRLVEKTPATVAPLPRSGVGSFAEFALWVDEEARRAARYAQEFAVLWLQVANWDEAIALLDEDDKRRALTALQALTRRCCRATDKIAALPTSELAGLQLFVLMPHTRENGSKTAQRWSDACRELEIPAAKTSGADSAGVILPLKTNFSFCVFPRDGSTSDELFRALGRQLREQEAAGKTS